MRVLQQCWMAEIQQFLPLDHSISCCSPTPSTRDVSTSKCTVFFGNRWASSESTNNPDFLWTFTWSRIPSCILMWYLQQCCVVGMLHLFLSDLARYHCSPEHSTWVLYTSKVRKILRSVRVASESTNDSYSHWTFAQFRIRSCILMRLILSVLDGWSCNSCDLLISQHWSSNPSSDV